MITLLLTLFLSLPSSAESLIVLSGEGKSLDPIPQALMASFQDSGVVLSGGEAMGSLEISSLKCEQEKAGQAGCTFRLKGETDRRAVKDPILLIGALRALNSDQAGLTIGSCENEGGCALELSSLTCMVNLQMPEEASGKYGCALVSL